MGRDTWQERLHRGARNLGVQEQDTHTPSPTTLLGTWVRPFLPRLAIFQEHQLSQCLQLSTPTGAAGIAVREVGMGVQLGAGRGRVRGRSPKSERVASQGPEAGGRPGVYSPAARWGVRPGMVCLCGKESLSGTKPSCQGLQNQTCKPSTPALGPCPPDTARLARGTFMVTWQHSPQGLSLWLSWSGPFPQRPPPSTAQPQARRPSLNLLCANYSGADTHQFHQPSSAVKRPRPAGCSHPRFTGNTARCPLLC